MARAENHTTRPVVPTPKTVEFARDLVHRLGNDSARFEIRDRQTGQSIEIDETAFELIRRILIDFAQNRPISLIPYDHELTTYQAADLLNVSRGYILKLLNEGKLSYRMVGTHRRIRLEDLLAYRDTMRIESEKAMQELANISQELELE